MIENFLFWLELTAIAVFALTGAIVAARNSMDPVGFVVLATATGVGGGTLRDAMLAKPVFWLTDPTDLLCCIIIAFLAFFARSALVPTERSGAHFRLLPWADAVGLVLFAIIGTERALAAGAHPIPAIVLGAVTATFGGVIRDVIIGKSTLIASQDIYISAAVVAAAVYVLASWATPIEILPPVIAFAAGFGLRAGAILFGWSLPK